MDKDKQNKFTDLRRQAEAAVQGQLVDIAKLSTDDIQHLVHELQVHQIELEMQNDELRMAQVELDAARARYFDLYDLAPVGYCTVSEKGLILEANLTVATLLDTTRSALVNQPISRFIIKEDEDIYYLHRKQLFESGEPQVYELRMVKSDNATIWTRLEAAIAQETDDASLVNRIVISDITGHKQMEQQLVRQERLAAVGQLAAGIAHDFNNILTSILGFAELLQMSPDTPEAMQSGLQKISASSQRAARLVRQILDFSQKTIRQPQPVDLSSLTEKSIKFLDSIIPEHIQINLNVESGDYLINADPTQLRQVITNLAVNARDAMPEGGELRIELSRVECEGHIHCAVCNQPIEGDWTQLKVTDTGSGIAADVLPRIFEPFFTTKKIGQGSGLGLSQISGIITQHGGHIRIESQVGQGTTFTISLPPLTVKEEPQKPEPIQIRRGQGETILLVEDDPTVLEVTTTMLEHLGYQVLAASKGAEAIKIFEDCKPQIALVLSDMVMPDMDGEALFHRLKATNSDLKMVMMSGYPLGERGAKLLEQGIVTWFQKPMTIGKLSQVVGKALSNRKGRWA